MSSISSSKQQNPKVQDIVISVDDEGLEYKSSNKKDDNVPPENAKKLGIDNSINNSGNADRYNRNETSKN